MYDLRHVTRARGDRVLQLAGLEIVEVEIAPVGALAVPDRLVRGRQGNANLRSRCRCGSTSWTLSSNTVAHRAGARVGDAEPFVLAVARGGHERQGLAVGRPLDVIPIAIGLAADVIAEAREPLLRRELQPHHLMAATAMTTGSIMNTFLSPGHGIFPLLEAGMSQPRARPDPCLPRCADPAGKSRSRSSPATS